jgi:hypothetical protein
VGTRMFDRQSRERVNLQMEPGCGIAWYYK